MVLVKNFRFYLGQSRVQNKRSEELCDCIEVRSQSDEFILHISNADDVFISQMVLDHHVIRQGRALPVDLQVTPAPCPHHCVGVLRQEFVDHPSVRSSPRHKRLHQNQLAHQLRIPSCKDNRKVFCQTKTG